MCVPSAYEPSTTEEETSFSSPVARAESSVFFLRRRTPARPHRGVPSSIDGEVSDASRLKSSPLELIAGPVIVKRTSGDCKWTIDDCETSALSEVGFGARQTALLSASPCYNP